MRKLLTRHSPLALAALAGVVLLAAPPRANADLLLGKQLSVQVYAPNLSTPLLTPTVFTANGTSNVDLSGNISNGIIVAVGLIVSDTTIEFIYKQNSGFTSDPFNGYVFKTVSPDIPAFTGLTVDPATTMAGFNQSRLSFTSNQINVNVQGLAASVGTILKLDLAVAPAAVPEPSTFVLLGTGVLPASLYAWRRRSRSRAATA